jgi:hypothetical protein
VINVAFSRIVQIATICLLILAATLVRAEDLILPLPPDDQRALAKLLGADVVGAALRSKPIDDPSTLFPFHHERMTYRFTSGKSTGKSQVETLAKIQRPGGHFVWRLQLAPSLQGFLRQTSEGDIVMPAVAETNEDALVITTPANPFVPKGMQPGETRSYSQQVSVRYFDDLSDEQYSGTLKSDYTYVGTFRVTVPAGTFDAALLRVKVEGKVGPARTHGTNYNFFAPGVGLVAMVLQQKVSAFWIYNVDSAGGKVLMSK